MSEAEGKPEWDQNYPDFKGGKKKPIRLTRDMEIMLTYGIDGGDLRSSAYVSTENITASDYNCAPGCYLNPPGVHCCEEVYYVVKGEGVVTNPDTGQCVRMKEGDAIVTPRGTLHQVHNFGETNLFVLCFTHKQWTDEEWEKLEGMLDNNK
jgi:mannose-6-phosphate isomerase-like protein (cupin superfamily)